MANDDFLQLLQLVQPPFLFTFFNGRFQNNILPGFAFFLITSLFALLGAINNK